MKDDVYNSVERSIYSVYKRAEARGLSYDSEKKSFKILYMDNYGGGNFYVYIVMDGCSYTFYANELKDYFEKKPTFELSECLCKIEDGNALYMNAEKSESSKLSDEENDGDEDDGDDEDYNNGDDEISSSSKDSDSEDDSETSSSSSGKNTSGDNDDDEDDNEGEANNEVEKNFPLAVLIRLTIPSCVELLIQKR